MSDTTPTVAMNPLAPAHLPSFLPAADGSDTLMTIAVYVLIVGAFMAGVFYLYLHSLPERMAHGHGRTQFQIVAILCLLALFTHQNIFWVAALLLAATTLPDYLTPLVSGARSLASLAGRAYEGDQPREDDFDHVPGTPVEPAEPEDPFDTARPDTDTPAGKV